MNPSASGWIKKLNTVLAKELYFSNTTESMFYNELRRCGFIYGTNLTIIGDLLPNAKLTETEMCKVNLYLAFRFVHARQHPKIDFLNSIIDFYKHIGAYKLSFFNELLGTSAAEEQLEDIIHKRSQIDDNIITKNFNDFLINGLLYIDVLAYSTYLFHKTETLTYLKRLEACIEVVFLNVMTSKSIKTAYDDSLIKLFEASLRYSGTNKVSYTTALSYIKSKAEKKYILDITCMATWSDQYLEASEQHFLLQLGHDFEMNVSALNTAIAAVNDFYNFNKARIALFSSKNSVQSFYTNSSTMVSKLISRNSKRLYEELVGSKELMVLLTQSTVRELTPKEQKKVQDQLLDIFKSIPSLALFLLPGGALLLPIVIKFIPKLLPSAFDDNRIDEDTL